MTDVLVLATDTDAGKTTFSILWMLAFGADFDYWKPVETGPSDTETVKRFAAEAVGHDPVKQYQQAVAPTKAAADAGDVLPSAIALAERRPQSDRRLLIETFGGPFSPLNELELQTSLVDVLNTYSVLIVSSAIGAVTRALSCLLALGESRRPSCVVMMGPRDEYAAGEISRRHAIPVLSLPTPNEWTVEEFQSIVTAHRATLEEIRLLAESPADDKNRGDWQAIIVADRQHLWHPYTSLGGADDPLVIDSAENEYLQLGDGRRVIDAISSWWTILHGHRFPPLMQTLHEASQRFDHVLFAGATHAHGVTFAQLLLQSLGWNEGRVFYSDDGSTAVEVALKMAYQFWVHRDEPQRRLFIGFENSYHGDTFGAMAASRDPVFFGTFDPLLFQTEIAPVCANSLNDLLRAQQGDVAGVIIEPLVQGAGGMQMHSEQTLSDIAEVVRDNDVLLIVDEVMTGGGRLGALWAHHAAGISPDLICSAKTLAGGILPLAATLASPKIVDAFQTDDPRKTFFHGHSFTGHPLACALAETNWRILTDNALNAPKRMEMFWQDEINPLQENPCVRDIRIKGSIAAVEIDAPAGYLAKIGRTMRHICLDEGVMLRPLGNVLYAMPPFCTSETSLHQIANAMRRAVAAVEAH